MITATSPRATASDHPAEDLHRAVPLGQVADLDHPTAPPFRPPTSSRRSDHRENHESGTLIAM